MEGEQNYAGACSSSGNLFEESTRSERDKNTVIERESVGEIGYRLACMPNAKHTHVQGHNRKTLKPVQLAS